MNMDKSLRLILWGYPAYIRLFVTHIRRPTVRYRMFNLGRTLAVCMIVEQDDRAVRIFTTDKISTKKPSCR